ncbi:MAG TPA: DUF3179 domain-containing (seleno)protein [Candidatus Limnocylindria bacterium]
MRWIATSLVAALLAACTSAPPDSGRPAASSASPPVGDPWPPVPAARKGRLAPDVAEAADALVAGFGPGRLDTAALDVVAESGDARLAWLVGDMLRFVAPGSGEDALVRAFIELTGTDPRADDRFGEVAWVAVSNLLMGWDLPAPPGYVDRKADLFLTIEPAWEPFFADADATIDWRWVSWGGVLIDDREIGDARPCRGGCIPALDDPALTSAAGGDWYADWRPVFGLVVGDEAVAFPKNIMEVHEMVNLTISGRRVGLPYCTLCASAQAYLTDDVHGAGATLVLRTTGLLSRSNKLMYDLRTWSTFNTFTGRATSGPLLVSGVVLEQLTVVATTWGAWKAAHPETKIVAEDGGIGRTYPDDPLEGRDEAGPIFPTGTVDARLPAQQRVVGAIGPEGAVAFPRDAAMADLAAGRAVRLGEVEAVESAGGLRIRVVGGAELPAHQAFWFAWSQFHPGTAVWSPGAP